MLSEPNRRKILELSQRLLLEQLTNALAVNTNAQLMAPVVETTASAAAPVATASASTDVSEQASEPASEQASEQASAPVSEPASTDASASVDASERYCNKVFNLLEQKESSALLAQIGAKLPLPSSLKEKYGSLLSVLKKDGRFKETTLNGAKAIKLVSDSDKNSLQSLRKKVLDSAAKEYKAENKKPILWLMCDSDNFVCTGETCTFVHKGEEEKVRTASGLPKFTTLCKNGPKCKFGVNCQNVHPEMGDSVPEKRQALEKKVICRFGSDCRALECEYGHAPNHVPAVAKYNKYSKPCNKGSKCEFDQCPYEHEIESVDNAAGSTSGRSTIADYIVSAADWNPDDDGINGSANAPVS
jgi:hypothetical protein